MKIDQSQITYIRLDEGSVWCARHPLCGSGRICSTMGQ